MHAPEYTAKIKALIAAKESADAGMAAALYNFRNGRKPSATSIEAARKGWAEALAIVDPEGGQAKAALDVVIEAAGKWRNELTEYIIPADESYGEDLEETAEGHRSEADQIDDAIKILQGGGDPNKDTLRALLKSELEALRSGGGVAETALNAQSALGTALALLNIEGLKL